jgi:hypothetical protein
MLNDLVECITLQGMGSLCLTRGAVHDGKPSVWDIADSRPLICVQSVFNLWLNKNRRFGGGSAALG